MYTVKAGGGGKANKTTDGGGREQRVGGLWPVTLLSHIPLFGERLISEAYPSVTK